MWSLVKYLSGRIIVEIVIEYTNIAIDTLNTVLFFLFYFLLSPLILMFPTSDIDECKTTQSLCEHKCINTNGTYACSCSSGSSLNSDGKTCTGNVFIYNYHDKKYHI